MVLISLNQDVLHLLKLKLLKVDQVIVWGCSCASIRNPGHFFSIEKLVHLDISDDLFVFRKGIREFIDRLKSILIQLLE